MRSFSKIVAVLFLLFIGVSEMRSQTVTIDTLYMEDFSDSTLSNWTVVSNNVPSHLWIWTNVEPGGNNSAGMRPMLSQTRSNGFIALPSDLYNSTIPAPANPHMMDSWIGSKAIPIQPGPNVHIHFAQSLRYCCSANAIIELEVSTDSVNWNRHDVKFLLLPNETWINHPSRASVPTGLSYIDTLYIRFRQANSSGYYWMIDDILITSANFSTGVDELDDQSGINFYPNPTSGKIFFENLISSELSVRDMNGRLVHSSTLQEFDTSLDLSFLENGIYFVHFRGEEELVKKVVIQK